MQLNQVNLQPYFGGGEVYTAFFTKALAQLGVKSRIFVHPSATYWPKMQLPTDTEIVVVPDGKNLESMLGAAPGWVIGHGPLTQPVIRHIKQHGGLATAIAHMPVQGRNPERYRGHDQIFAVSGWVLEGLHHAGLPAWPQPLYGVADFRGQDQVSEIWKRSAYDWDRRKARDRLLSWLEPLATPFFKTERYTRRPGLTLGIVSRITPIKQFPLLFGQLAPVFERVPGVNLEIFGSGGYASMRDLKKALSPLSGRVRFWGHQSDVFSVYRNIDYLMTGLPEKEALGLNVLEAQACGTPVLAPASPPFTETVVDGETGYLYMDPRKDGAQDFERLLLKLLDLRERPDTRLAVKHLSSFSFDALVERLKPLLVWASEAQA